MEPHATRSALLAGLSAGAEEFRELLAGAQARDWLRRPAPGEWSLTEICCHLRDVEREVHLERLRRVAQQADTFLSPANPGPLAEERDYQSQDGRAALAEFLARRRELMVYISGLPDDVWQRTARHALFGRTHFSELIALIIDHDRAHIDQVRALIAGT